MRARQKVRTEDENRAAFLPQAIARRRAARG
jgi:hypothetical protein